MDRLPFELLDLIAKDETTYRGLLAIPYFARTIDQSRRIDFMIKFGHTVEINAEYTKWYKNGKLHRLDGPALKCAKYEEWYRDGKRHREDGPAIEYARGDKKWYKYGKFHRLDGPAIEYARGDKHWFINGILHREDGPAVKSGAYKEWWIDGKQLTEKEFLAKSD